MTTRATVSQSAPIRCFFPPRTWRGRKVILNTLPSTLKPTCEKSISHVERWNRKCAPTSLQPHFLLHSGCNLAVTSCLNTRPRVGPIVGEALPEEACSPLPSQMLRVKNHRQLWNVLRGMEEDGGPCWMLRASVTGDPKAKCSPLVQRFGRRLLSLIRNPPLVSWVFTGLKYARFADLPSHFHLRQGGC